MPVALHCQSDNVVLDVNYDAATERVTTITWVNPDAWLISVLVGGATFSLGRVVSGERDVPGNRRVTMIADADGVESASISLPATFSAGP